ncbi:hydrolase [Streptomyces xantholiticus]|nr:hydrolase [Streptomyces xantholiticus]
MAAFTEGTPCWVDASLPDVEAGKRFYGELFGWTFTHRGGGQVPGGVRGREADAYSDGRLVAALTPKRDGRMPTVWGVYFAAPDAAALGRRIADKGGQVIIDPLPKGPTGTSAVVADPRGAVFGLWQGGERSGFEKHGEPNSFCWTEVYTRDQKRTDDFYESVFGFQGTDLTGPMTGFRMWSPAGTEPGEATAVGGRSLITDEFPPEMPDHFLVYFCVTDCDAAAETVVRLGGRVRTAPADTPYGRIATFGDDQGAVFAVLAAPDRTAAPGGEKGGEEAPESGGPGRFGPQAPEAAEEREAARAAPSDDSGSASASASGKDGEEDSGPAAAKAG